MVPKKQREPHKQNGTGQVLREHYSLVVPLSETAPCLPSAELAVGGKAVAACCSQSFGCVLFHRGCTEEQGLCAAHQPCPKVSRSKGQCHTTSVGRLPCGSRSHKTRTCPRLTVLERCFIQGTTWARRATPDCPQHSHRKTSIPIQGGKNPP